MDLSQFWFQSGGGGGYQIGNALRFRGSGINFPATGGWLGQDNPSSGGSTTQWTCSFWTKRGNAGAERMLLSSIYQPNDGEAFSVYFNSSDQLIWGMYFSPIFITTQLFRDYSAWYHIVLVWDSANATAAHRCRLYVNGEEVTTWSTRNDPALNAGNPWCQNGPVPGGSQNLLGYQRGIGVQTWYQSSPYNGYMAEFHCVQGQALEPTEFGEYNNDGVWVPKAADLAIPAYGTPGTDWAGAWSAGAINPGNAFDGDIATSTAATGVTTWTAPAPVTGTTFRIYCAAGASRGQIGGDRNWFTINGTDISQKILDATYVGGELEKGWLDISAEAAGNLSTITMIEQSAITNPGLYLIEVDGAYVGVGVSGYGTNGFYLDFSDAADIGADRSGNGNDFTATGFELSNTASTSYDLMEDSPTDNFATLNPLCTGAPDNTTAPGLEWGNIHVGNSGGDNDYLFNATCEIPATGKWYWEHVCENVVAALDWRFGIQETKPTPKNQWIDNSTQRELGYVSSGVTTWRIRNSSIESNSPAGGFSLATGDVIGVAVDMDVNLIQLYRNGVLTTGISDQIDPTKTHVPSHLQFRQANVGGVNYGQLPFRHAPPAGFEPLSTAGLPAVAITNPSEHCTTILDTGANILTNAQATFPNGLWWIKNRLSDDHQFVDSVRGAATMLRCPNTGGEVGWVNPPSSSVVAWCWNAGGAPVTNNDGSITSQVSANPTAGFSIVSYTGVAPSGTIGHGLNATPAFIITKNRDVTNPWGVYHKDLGGNTKYLRLNENTSVGTSSAIWNATSPTDTVFSVGNDGTSNGTGEEMIAYCWAEVPGYSSFGSYVANNSLDGPFVFTGFRPALVVCKSVSAGDWLLYDNKRLGYNPTTKALFANQTYNEQDVGSVGYGLDFLSNGFKLRTNSNPNESSHTYIYMAFAEHPFGGSNISPSPAR